MSNLANCRKCGLYEHRIQVVKGRGPKKPRFILIGEAPGKDEDRIGRPFVGRAGKMLDRLIKFIPVKRSEIFIMNTVCCRPPNNRKPTLKEQAVCYPRMERTLKRLDCNLIVCAGAIPAQSLLGLTSVGASRQRLHKWKNKIVVVVYHPAYFLRNKKALYLGQEDFEFVGYLLKKGEWDV